MTIDIDPVAFRLFGASVHWYGLMYILGFYLFFNSASKRIGRKGEAHLMHAVLNNWLLHYSIVGVLIGGRLGYVLFYAPGYYASNPLGILKIWEGGMSFHGGLIGVLAAVLLTSRMSKISFFAITDFIAPFVPIGLGLGRLGNFINGELWGRATELPWGVVFPDGGNVTRHPSQLYELALEGVALWLILSAFSKKPRPLMQTSALFLVAYGVFRFGVEFTREPDSHLGLLALDLSMGQWLSLPMVLLGGFLFLRSRGQEPFQYVLPAKGRKGSQSKGNRS